MQIIDILLSHQDLQPKWDDYYLCFSLDLRTTRLLSPNLVLSKYYPVSAGMLYSSAFLPLKEFNTKTILGLAAIFNPKVSLKATSVVG
jgi:hypothetical protein